MVQLTPTAMVLKILNNRQQYKDAGLTLVELIVVIAILVMLMVSAVFILRPDQKRKKAQDEKRLSDISMLERAINEYLVDNGNYPDEANVTRISTTLPPGSPGSLASSTAGWINQDLSRYVARLPLDPINDGNYYYSYRHTVNAYELNARLEYLTEYAVNSYDGGNDDALFEAGNNLTIL